MKFNRNVTRTYGAVIALLVLLTAIISHQIGAAPVATLVAIPVAIMFNFCITRLYLKSRFKLPLSAVITSMIITLVIPQGTSIFIVICAVILAELSKYLIRLKGSNIFNPAAIGLIVPLVVFNVSSTSWANTNSAYLSLPLLLLLGLGIYSAKRASASMSFGAVFVFLSIISLGLVKSFSVTWVSILLLSGYYVIAFVMLSDPKTSPNKTLDQCAYGAGIGFLTFVFSAIGLSFAFLIALLLGNLAYSICRPARNG